MHSIFIKKFYHRIWRHRYIVATAVLIFSVGLVMLGFLSYYLTGDRYTAKKTLILPLQLATGKGRTTSDGLEIHKLSPNNVALLAVKTNFSAQNFSTLEWKIKGMTPKTRLSFMWVTSAASNNEGALSITDIGSENGQIRLDNHPQWQKKIHGILLVIEGELLNPLLIEQLALTPPFPQPLQLFDQLWSEWTTFERWRGQSINFFIGGSRHGLFPLVLAAATWAVLSALLYSGLVLMRLQRRDPKPFIFLFLTCWLALDLHWQINLWEQLNITWKQYAGKSWHEKKLAAQDAELFQFAQNIKQQILETSARIFIMTKNPAESSQYTRLRLLYHLLPHNSFIYDKGFKAKRLAYQDNIRPGDYILILNQNVNVNDISEQDVLTWEDDGKTLRLAVRSIFSDQLGDFYRAQSWK